jgi:hypothetical protein
LPVLIGWVDEPKRLTGGGYLEKEQELLGISHRALQMPPLLQGTGHILRPDDVHITGDRCQLAFVQRRRGTKFRGKSQDCR